MKSSHFLSPVAAHPSLPRAAQLIARSQTEGPQLLLPPDALASARLIFATAAAGGHDMPGHPECAARVDSILTALNTYGLSSHAGVQEIAGFGRAPASAITPVHTSRYLKALERTSESARDVANITVDPAPTYVTATTNIDALRAAGAAMALVDHVVAATAGAGAKAPTAFAICRPPGHHAVPAHGMGFCLLNNVAVAARHAQEAHGLQRVAIYDFDVHHGNGTSDVFEKDPSVLFVSTHQANNYPFTGKIDEVGVDGNLVNIPLPGDSGHSAALAAFEEVVGPAICRFKPDILLVSAGYDAEWRDPLGGLQFTNSTFFELSAKLKALADEVCAGRLVFLLEGGYNLEALGESVASTWAAVLGEKGVGSIDPAMLQEEPIDKVKAVLLETRRVHGL